MIQNTDEYYCEFMHARQFSSHTNPSNMKKDRNGNEWKKIQTEFNSTHTQRKRICRWSKNCILCIQVIELWRGNLISSTFICRKCQRVRKRTEKVLKRFDKDHFIDIVYKRLFQPRKWTEAKTVTQCERVRYSAEHYVCMSTCLNKKLLLVLIFRWNVLYTIYIWRESRISGDPVFICATVNFKRKRFNVKKRRVHRRKKEKKWKRNVNIKVEYDIEEHENFENPYKNVRRIKNRIVFGAIYVEKQYTLLHHCIHVKV